MLSHIFKYFSDVVYAQIWSNRIRVRNITNGLIFDDEPLIALGKNKKGQDIIVGIGREVRKTDNSISIMNPFLHPRVLISDFEKAEKIMQHAIREVHKNYKYFRYYPSVVVHPMEKLEGGLTDIEDRAIRELMFGAGAYKIALYQGKELSIFDSSINNILKENG